MIEGEDSDSLHVYFSPWNKFDKGWDELHAGLGIIDGAVAVTNEVSGHDQLISES